MPQTANSQSDRSRGPNTAYLELSRMMREGRSWSGRERNCAFLNTRDGRFATISAVSGFDYLDDARAVALSDWDSDGDVDLWVSNRGAPRLRLLRNEAPRVGRFLAVRLEGDGARTNRDAVGARVEVHLAGGQSLRRTVRAGEGFLSQSSSWLTFGMGAADVIERFVVRWPGGGVEEHKGVEVDHHYVIVQGSSRPREWRRPAPAAALRAAAQHPLAASARARVPAVTLLTVPDAVYERFDGTAAPLPLGGGKSVLVLLWASWCGPCVEELGEISSRAEDLRAAGVDVVALAADGVGADQGQPAAAEQALRKLRFPFVAGRATEGLIRILQRLHDAHVSLHRPLPLPSSFLVDPAGRLAVVYKGRASVDSVLADLRHSRLSRRERWQAAAGLPGTALEHPLMEAAYDAAEAATRFLFALSVAGAGRVENAVREYQEILRLKPDFVEAHNNLGLLCWKEGDLAAAEAAFRRAIDLRPEAVDAWYNLGKLLAESADARGAAACFERVFALRPEYPGVANQLGLLHARAGRIAAADRAFRSEIERHPENAEAHNNLALALMRAKDLRAAEASLREALRLDPRYVEALNNLGALYLETGRSEEAAAHFRRAVEIDPAFEPARRNLEKLERR